MFTSVVDQLGLNTAVAKTYDRPASEATAKLLLSLLLLLLLSLLLLCFKNVSLLDNVWGYFNG